MQIIKKVFRSLGYDISRIDRVGVDPFADMARLLPLPCTVFDVGANVGQSAKTLRKRFPNAEIHSFEPGRAFDTLRREVGSDPAIHLWNCGLGAKRGRLDFYEHPESVLSSFLPTGKDAWSSSTSETRAEIETVDSFCEQHSIDCIDVLKSDTQGYDLDVLKGANRMLRERRIKLVYVELNVAELYHGQGTIAEIYTHLADLGFRLFSFYQIFRREGLAVWTDALFTQESLIPGILRQHRASDVRHS